MCAQPDNAVVSLETDDVSYDELISVVPELEKKIKDLERKTANLFMDNVALSTKLKASRAVETKQEENNRNIEERLVQVMKEQVSILICSFTHATALILYYMHVFWCLH